MDSLEVKMQKIIELENKYLSSASNHINSIETVDLYINWHSKSCVLFSEYFSEDNPNYAKFLHIDNSGNGYVLKDNYNEINSAYSILFNQLKKMDKSQQIQNKITQNNSKDIFIVHGHDSAIKSEVARFVEKIGYNPIILHEQADMGRTIIQKLEDNISKSCFGIVIYTGCDEGRCRKGNEELRKRARQNVVFEHGYLRARLGPERVCSVYENEVELPTDLNGVLYKLIDESNAWKYAIAKEMKAAGLEVDMNSI